MKFIVRVPQQLSLKIAAARKEKGLTQAAMAETLGLSQQAYARFELNPEKSSFQRVFTVLRKLDLWISVDGAEGSPGVRDFGADTKYEW